MINYQGPRPAWSPQRPAPRKRGAFPAHLLLPGPRSRRGRGLYIPRHPVAALITVAIYVACFALIIAWMLAVVIGWSLWQSWLYVTQAPRRRRRRAARRLPAAPVQAPPRQWQQPGPPQPPSRQPYDGPWPPR